MTWSPKTILQGIFGSTPKDIKSTETGQLQVVNASVISTLNSSTTPIAIAGNFTGDFEYNVFPNVQVSLISDVELTVYFDFTVNGGLTFTSYPSNPFFTISGQHFYHTANVGSRGFRIRVLNNSGLTPTYMYLETEHGLFDQGIAPANQALGPDADARSVRPTKFEYEVALGIRSGSQTWNKWGYNPDITTTQETVWSVGGLFTRLTTAEILTIAFPDAADRTGGTGMTAVIIYGVGAGWVQQTEIVLASGANVDTTKTWLGINRISGYTFGSGGRNVGLITATAKISLTVQAQIPVGKGSTQHAFFFVPAGYTYLVDWMTINTAKISGGGTPILSTVMNVTSLVSGGIYEVFSDYLETAVSDIHEYTPSQPFVVGEKSLCAFRSITDTGKVAVNIRFSGILKKNL